MAPSIITAKHLADLLLLPSSSKDNASGKDYNKTIVVVDVRDEDRRGGHIVGSVHAPSRSFEPGTLLDRFPKSDGKSVLFIFHCMMSQVRGPSCARQMQKHIDDRKVNKNISVSILEGGFSRWQTEYGHDARLTADYDIAGWKMSFYS